MKNISIYLGIALTGILLFKINEGDISATSVLMEMNAIPVEEVSAEEPIIDDNLTIMAFGDVMLGRYVRTLMDRHGKEYIFAKLDMDSEPFFGDTDLVFANLEGPIKGEGYKHQTAMVFGFHTDTAEFLKNYGFNILSIANNHALDQKPEGRDTTIQALEEAGLGWCGDSKNVDQNSVHYGKAGELTYSFLCFNDVIYPLDKMKAIELTREVSETVDYSIVSIHWGYEYKHNPSEELQIKLGHAFIDAGADFIIGHHPHVVQSFEKYNGKFIFYSLGNFIFDQYWSQDTQEELGIKIKLKKDGEHLRTQVELFPMRSDLSQPRLMEGDEKIKWIGKFIGYGKYDENTIMEIRNGVLTTETEEGFWEL